MTCEESVRCVNMGLRCTLLRFIRGSCVTSSAVKLNSRPCAALRSLTQSVVAFLSSSLYLKKEKENKAKVKGKLGI
jgi:hypothetical protein